MSAISPVGGKNVERCSNNERFSEEYMQIEMERKQSENFDLAFLAFCITGLIASLVGFATGSIPLQPNQS